MRLAARRSNRQIGRAGISISFDDETKLDTKRIQAALDQCPTGRSVVLKKSSERLDAFLSGPLDLRRGVVLVVDAGTHLYASRNPRDYDQSPGECGTIDEKEHGCRAIKAPTGKPTTHMSITHNGFYSGHGMSIGSITDGGASAIVVSDLSIDGSDNGLRTKSNSTRGGLVHDVVLRTPAS